MSLNKALEVSPSLTGSIQDYLKSIYDLTQAGVPASTTDLAARLGVAPASVTEMVQKLAGARQPLVLYRKHQGATLTTRGRRAALEVIRHHRLLETWLVKTLGYTWDEVHAEAENLEHAISEDLEQRISAALGNPARDPHGEPIPSAELTIPADESIPLSTLRPFQDAVVRRVHAPDAAFLRRLERIGVHIGSRVRVLDISPDDKVSRLRVRGRRQEAVLGQAITSRVYVERVGREGRHT